MDALVGIRVVGGDQSGVASCSPGVELNFADDSFDQIFTSCTFCSVPRPVEGLISLRRVLKPGGELYMFEHTGSRYYPFKFMMNLMTLVTRRVGPESTSLRYRATSGNSGKGHPHTGASLNKRGDRRGGSL